MKKNIAIIGGGYSSEAEISMKSTYQLMEMMDSTLFDLFPVCITKTAWTAQVGNQEYTINKEDFSFEMNGTKVTFDCVYNS
ncbi:MAG: D-alanine--D-alanine ligase, partial [Bacteroidales bacterium]|nr:D-alanine--D-alanine ligase [Bacteroidales bacterium]